MILIFLPLAILNGGNPGIRRRSVIGMDRDFTVLYIAKQRIASAKGYIGMDVDQRLPFSNGYLSGVLCSDAFHCFVQSATAVDQMLRTIHLGRRDCLGCATQLGP
jgi:Methyltransferase domain